VIGDLVAQALRDRPLPLFDALVRKLLHVSAIDADDVVVVHAFVELEDRRAALEVMPRDEAGRFELREHAVHGGQADVLVELEEPAVDIFGAHVTHRRARQDLEDLQARRGDLEPSTTKLRRFH